MVAKLEDFGGCSLEQDGCPTCRDTAIAVKILRLMTPNALVEDRLGQQATVALDFIYDPKPGDVILVHGGVALSKLGG